MIAFVAAATVVASLMSVSADGLDLSHFIDPKSVEIKDGLVAPSCTFQYFRGHSSLLRTETTPSSSIIEATNVFFSKKEKLLRWLESHNNTKLLDFGQVSCSSCFAAILNDEYAFRHIYKAGGTAVMAQTGRKEVREKDYGNRLLLATVRDPIDHFLSGWAECGRRNIARMANKKQAINDINATSYDDRVFQWLGRAMRHQYNTPNEWYTCINHSLPQANYLLRKTQHPRLIQYQRRKHGQSYHSSNYFHPRLDLVGDMYELPELLRLVGFDYNETIGIPNNATSNSIVNILWPKNKSLLSNRTVDALCKFLALDYYLFDFEPPVRCQDWIRRDRNVIDKCDIKIDC